MKSDRYLASRLLSKKEGLSVLEKEEILGNILRDQAAREPERAPRGLVFGRRLAGLALLAVAILVPVLLLNTPEPPQEEFLPRGGQDQSVYTVRCLGPDGGTSCQQGDKLLFEFSASIEKPFFAAFSKAQDGTIIWYFPGGKAKKSIKLAQAAPDRILSTGILLGPEHPPGDYEVYGIFSDQPLDRSAIRAIFKTGKIMKDTSYRVDRTALQVRAK